MNSVPLLSSKDDDIRESLSLEEIQIALSILRKRFRQYTAQEIVNALRQYLAQKEYEAQSVPIGRGPGLKFTHLKQGNFMHHRQYPTVPEERNHKSQQVRLVAKLYAESGINYALAQYFFPQMTQKQYKSNLEMITAQTLNNIEKFLRYQCNIQVEQLSRQQKYSIRQKMINMRDWLGKTNSEQMHTYFLFIERYYMNENIEIEYKQAIELYKLILQSVKGPDVDLRQNEQQSNRGLRHQFRMEQEDKKPLTKEEENALILLFKQHASVQKVSDALCQKYRYDIKWSVHSIRSNLKRIYKSSLMKLVNASTKFMQKSVELWFGYGDEDVNTLMEYENSLPIKILLLDFYMLTKITKMKLSENVKKVNAFYIKQHKADQGFQAIPEEEVRIPTLIIDDKPIPTIVIKDQDNMVTNQAKKQANRSLNIRRKSQEKKKKKYWKQVVQLQQSSDEEEVFIFSHDRSYFEKSDQQDDTDVEDEIPQRKREKQIFRPNSVVREQHKQQKIVKDLKEMKNTKNSKKIIQQKPQKPQKSSQQKPQQEEQVKAEEVQVVIKEPIMTKPNQVKKSRLNHSFESISSEPARLNMYNRNISKGQTQEQLRSRFKRKATHQNGERMDLEQ